MASAAYVSFPAQSCPFSHATPRSEAMRHPQGMQVFPCLSLPTCTSNNCCWFLSSLSWPRGPGCCMGVEGLEPGLGTDLPTSVPPHLVAAEAAQAFVLAPQEGGVCMFRQVHCLASRSLSPLRNNILPEGSILCPGLDQELPFGF